MGLHLKEAFADIPHCYMNHFKAKHYDLLRRVYLHETIKKHQMLSNKYLFYHAYKQAMYDRYGELSRNMITKQREIQQLQIQYINYRRSGTFTVEHNLNWIKQNKLLKRLKIEWFEQFYASYYPLDAARSKKYIEEYEHALRTKLNLEKMDNANKKMMKNKQYLTQKQNEKSRITKLIGSPVIKNEIEKKILLKLYPKLCLKPSVEVMQVMNYAHYVRDQNLVRSSFNHKQIAQKMKAYYHYKHGHNSDKERNEKTEKNKIVEGINHSQKFLHFIAKNGNEKLLNMLEAMRNDTKYLYDKGEEKESEPRMNKHPGQWVPTEAPWKTNRSAFGYIEKWSHNNDNNIFDIL